MTIVILPALAQTVSAAPHRLCGRALRTAQGAAIRLSAACRSCSTLRTRRNIRVQQRLPLRARLYWSRGARLASPSRRNGAAASAAAEANSPSEEPVQRQPIVVLLRRLFLISLTFVLAFQPGKAFLRAIVLGAFAVVCLSREPIKATIQGLMEPPAPSLPGLESTPVETALGLPRFLRWLPSGPPTKLFGVAIYILAGLCEIGGGWMVWECVRSGRPWYWALAGSAVLVAYGVVATLQPVVAFARVYAVYGGYFIILSLLWGRLVDGFKPDTGDFVGAALIITGVAVMTLWPRTTG